MTPTPGPGLAASLRNLAASLVGIGQTRLELLSVELQEEKLRIGALLAYGAAAVLLIGFGLVFLAVFLTVLLWDSHRLLALGVFTALFLVLGGLCAALASKLAKQGSRLFAASLAELAQDREALRPPQ